MVLVELYVHTVFGSPRMGCSYARNPSSKQVFNYSILRFFALSEAGLLVSGSYIPYITRNVVIHAV